MTQIKVQSAPTLTRTLNVLFAGRECTRGGFCNFMHLKPISRELRRELYGRRRKRFVFCDLPVSSGPLRFIILQHLQYFLYFILSLQAPLSLTFPGSALPFQGSWTWRWRWTGPWAAKVKGPGTLWKILNQAKIQCPTNTPPYSPAPTSDGFFFLFFFFWWNIQSV